MAAAVASSVSVGASKVRRTPGSATAVAIPSLSFATDLLFNLDDVRTNCAAGLTTQTALVTLLKSRIALERHYANELSKMAKMSQLEELEHGTMREALGKLKAQYLNTSVQHRILANNLEEDVLRPIEALFSFNNEKAQNLSKLVNNIKKQAKVQEDVYKKDYQAFDKTFRDAATQFGVAMDAGFSSTVIEQQYHQQLIQMGQSEYFEDYSSLSLNGSGSPVEGRPRQKSAAAMQTINNNSQKLVNWLLSSEQQRKENLCTKAVQALEVAEWSRRKCQQSWESVEQSRIDMYRALQSVLTEYQQMAEHRISNLATNLRKHVVFESSALANEQYDWQMIASKIENVDFEGDIREFIMDHFSHDLESMTVNDLCHTAATSSLVFSPNSKPCRPLKKEPLQIADLALRKIPYDYQGNQDSLAEVLVTRSTPSAATRFPAGATAAAIPAARADAEASSPQGSANHQRLSVQVTAPAADRNGTHRDLVQCRVSMAQDVARAIAHAYELRSVQKNSLQSPQSFRDTYEQENNLGDVMPSTPQERSPPHESATVAQFQSNDVDDEAPDVADDMEEKANPSPASHAADVPAAQHRVEDLTVHTTSFTHGAVLPELYIMEDYIQGVLCGYLTVQSGTRDDAKRTRMFVVLSDSRMDFYLTDPRPEFEESIASTYTFSSVTQALPYVEINPRAPLNSLCLIADKMTDVYIADSALEADTWLQHLKERLAALSQIITGPLMVRDELSVKQQVQRKLLQTKYKWKPRELELGRSTIRYCREAERTTKLMKQFNLTGESNVSEEPVEVLKSVPLLGFATSAGAVSASDLKKIQKDPQLQQRARGGGSVVFPFAVCTGHAHLYLAAPTEKAREEWVVSIRMRIIALKYRHNRAKPVSDGIAGSEDTSAVSALHLHDFMEVQFTPGGAWKKRFVELENEMLKVKVSDRQLGSKFESRLLPTCYLAPSLIKANAFVVKNRGQEIALAPGTLKESQQWMQAIKATAHGVSAARCQKVFDDDVRALLERSVLYTLEVGEGASAGLVVEKHKKRIFVLSHAQAASGKDGAASGAAATTATAVPPTATIPEGSVLIGITQVGVVHDSFETIWHKLRQKRGFPHPMKLTFRAPLRRDALVDVKFRNKDKWLLRRCTLAHGKFRVETVALGATPAIGSSGGSAGPRDAGVATPATTTVLVDVSLRYCRVELVSVEECGARNAFKIVTERGSGPAPSILVRTHHDDDLLAWIALLQLECAIAQDDPRYPLTPATMKKAKPSAPSPLGGYEDQRRQCAKCKIAGKLLVDIDEHVRAIEPKLMHAARQDMMIGDGESLHLSSIYMEPTLGLTDGDVQQLFQHLDVIGCGKISSTALHATLDAVTRHLEPSERDATRTSIESALQKLLPPNRAFASITLEQTRGVMRNATHPQVVDLVRKFSRHDVQCM